MGRLLAVTGGHRVDEQAFTAMVGAVCESIGWSWDHVEQPAAQDLLNGATGSRWNAVLLHDIAGLRLARGAEPSVTTPPPATVSAVEAMLDAGVGIVATHHALASWPDWDRWAHVIGGRFLYAPGRLDGVDLPSSGYRMAEHRVEVVAPGHPVCRGVDAFEVDDELYLCPVFAGEVTPLLATTADMSSALFASTFDEVTSGRTEVTCAGRPAGSPLVGWATAAGRSRVVYLQPGHGPATMAHPQYRRLLANALEWVAPRAHQQAAGPE